MNEAFTIKFLDQNGPEGAYTIYFRGKEFESILFAQCGTNEEKLNAINRCIHLNTLTPIIDKCIELSK